jgi:hypothetical protein
MRLSGDRVEGLIRRKRPRALYAIHLLDSLSGRALEMGILCAATATFIHGSCKTLFGNCIEKQKHTWTTIGAMYSRSPRYPLLLPVVYVTHHDPCLPLSFAPKIKDAVATSATSAASSSTPTAFCLVHWSILELHNSTRLVGSLGTVGFGCGGSFGSRHTSEPCSPCGSRGGGPIDAYFRHQLWSTHRQQGVSFLELTIRPLQHLS